MHPRLVQGRALSLIRTRDRIQTPLLPGLTPTRHPDPRVRAQGLVLVRPTARRDAEGAFPRQIVAIVVAEAQPGESVTQARIFPMTTGGDDSHHIIWWSYRSIVFYVDPPHFVS